MGAAGNNSCHSVQEAVALVMRHGCYQKREPTKPLAAMVAHQAQTLMQHAHGILHTVCLMLAAQRLMAWPFVHLLKTLLMGTAPAKALEAQPLKGPEPCRSFGIFVCSLIRNLPETQKRNEIQSVGQQQYFANLRSKVY